MRFLRLLPAAALVVATGSAHATPVLHNVSASLSNVSATVSGTLAITVHSNLGDVPGTATASGPLSSTNESGTVNLEWGSPSWNSSLAVGAGQAAFNTGPSGSATGSATLNLFNFIPVTFNLTVSVNNITLSNATAYGPIPTAPASPSGPGPWTTIGITDLNLGASINFSATGPFGINVGASNLAIGPSPVTGIPVPLTLARVGGNPGTGSSVTLTIPSGLSLSLPAQPTSNISTPGCEAGQTSLGCALNVTSVDVTLTSLTFSNLSGTLVALSNTVIVPEPATLALLGAGLAGLLAFGRHARRR